MLRNRIFLANSFAYRLTSLIERALISSTDLPRPRGEVFFKSLKTYEYVSTDPKHIQTYFLLRAERNIDVVMPIAQAVFRRGSFVEEQVQ